MIAGLLAASPAPRDCRNELQPATGVRGPGAPAFGETLCAAGTRRSQGGPLRWRREACVESPSGAEGKASVRRGDATAFCQSCRRGRPGLRTLRAMRASPTRVRGNADELQVTAAFSELGWGAVLRDSGEDGTDVLGIARSDDLLALGTLIGAQVKTGASFFRSPVREGRRIVGWWFDQADQGHVDYWLGR